MTAQDLTVTRTQDDLCCIAKGYLRHAASERALVLLLLAMHMGDPSQRILLLLAKCFLKQKNAMQARAVLERCERTFGADRLTQFMLAQCQRLEETEAGIEASQ